MMNEGVDNEEEHVNSDIDGSDREQTQVPETQENEEVYRVNIEDESRLSTESTRDATRIPSSITQQRGNVSCASNTKRGRKLKSCYRK
ncbi:unnamed protein product [Arabidopsis thaliana]|uniref:(thale cress) hypothetical protein n=1 Tax=Arabidopsis thaliana TaxID=3702 RepID=A0A7G2FEV7_ARATH|nr:unnamed protein product [Arabidopsis thaliana]